MADFLRDLGRTSAVAGLIMVPLTTCVLMGLAWTRVDVRDSRVPAADTIRQGMAATSFLAALGSCLCLLGILNVYLTRHSSAWASAWGLTRVIDISMGSL